MIAQMPEECFMFFWLLLGKERLPLSSGAEKLIGESLREALLSTSRMRGRFCLNRLQARLGVNSSLGWIAGLCGFQALLKLPSSLLLAVCLLLKAPMFDTGQWEESSKGRYPEHEFLRSVAPARAESPSCRVIPASSRCRVGRELCAAGTQGPTGWLLPCHCWGCKVECLQYGLENQMHPDLCLSHLRW